MKLPLSMVSLLFLLLVLCACSAGMQTQYTLKEAEVVETGVIEQSNLPTEAPSKTAAIAEGPVASSTPSESQIAAETAEVLPVTGKPPQSQASGIRPPEMREQLTRLSNLLNFQVVDRDGNPLGTASNYIINTCETYIIYFLVEPASTLNLASGTRLVIPFEAVTINSGILDAQAKAIVLYLGSDQFASAPVIPESLELLPPTWEGDVRAYWSGPIWLSNLTTECRVASPGGDGGTVAVYKDVYATGLLGAELQDGLKNPLGRVEEAILEPESGKLGFFVVNLHDSQERLLVPLRAVNIPKEALIPGNEVSLVLLTENTDLLNAPRIETVEQASSMDAQNAARQYWNE